MIAPRNRIGARLRSLRAERGLTQAQVARELGVRRPAISEIEAGRRSVSSEELRALSRVYAVPPSRLLEDRPSRIEAQIARMTRIIVDRFDPEKVILFGSHAQGAAGPDSDVDLLVVMDVAGSKREMAVAIGAELHDVRLPKDVIVTTPEEFAWRREVPGTIERPADRQGRVLYERG